MKAKHTDLEIPKDNPFTNCNLGRRADADALNTLIESIEGGGTIAINGAWGFGKTTFLHMWQKDLEQKGYRVILFNAWETDFSTEPLVSILGELREIILPKKKKEYDRIAQRTYNLFKKGLPTLVSLKTGNPSIEKLITALISCFDNGVKDYAKNKKEFQTIKNSLEDLVLCNKSSKPVIFIVDELDRCRPDYAVEVLEKIKHLFSVNNLIFVLAVDKEQLCHAIKGYYGSSEFNASEYLRRFIDIEYNLDCNYYLKICEHFYQYFGLGVPIESMWGSSVPAASNDHLTITTILSVIAQEFRLSIRQIEKLMLSLKIALTKCTTNKYIPPGPLVLLSYLKLFHLDVYNSLKNTSLELPEFIDKMETMFQQIVAKESSKTLGLRANYTLTHSLSLLYHSYYLTLLDNKHYSILTSSRNYYSFKEITSMSFQKVPHTRLSDMMDYVLKTYGTTNFPMSNIMYCIEGK